MKKFILIRYLSAVLLFFPAAFLAAETPVFSCALFFIMALSQCIFIYLERRSIVDLTLLFSASWLSGIALSVLKLSKLQHPWGVKMWAAVGIAYFGLHLMRDLFDHFMKKREKAAEENMEEKAAPLFSEAEARRILEAVGIVLVLGLLSFGLEAVKFRFELPILSKKPHMYSEFHITGVHYFVVSVIFIPMLSFLYLYGRKPKAGTLIFLFIANMAAFVIPVLILSKYQLMITILMPFILLFLTASKKMRRKLYLMLPILIAVLAAVFLFLVLRRHYPKNYLVKLFCFKDPEKPVWFQYIYMYIVNNFENLNLLTENLQSFSFGIRGLFPLFALTGTKFLPAVQQLMTVEQYLTVQELTTVSMIYDAYGDFGLPGVFVLSSLLGIVISYLSVLIRRRRMLGYLLYAQFGIYMLLSFFTTWFSNPTVWFYFIASFVIALYVTRPEKRFRFSLKEVFLPRVEDEGGHS
ncbi:MAG: oligosaccharide repeat unit polymerase [Lachnospiraceae bacterium]|nr:oligosaccharide repeat unit polymerase [Lachnospiraceae bacterium]